MMHPRELRIGNKVIACAEEIITIDKIAKDGVNYPTNDSHLDIYSDDCMFQYSSLSEILLNSDFLDRQKSITKSENANGVWEISKDSTIELWGIGSACVNIDGDRSEEVKYYHELQNIVHCLVGIEI